MTNPAFKRFGAGEEEVYEKAKLPSGGSFEDT
jgi:hypothetical protein